MLFFYGWSMCMSGCTHSIVSRCVLSLPLLPTLSLPFPFISHRPAPHFKLLSVSCQLSALGATSPLTDETLTTWAEMVVFVSVPLFRHLSCCRWSVVSLRWNPAAKLFLFGVSFPSCKHTPLLSWPICLMFITCRLLQHLMRSLLTLTHTDVYPGYVVSFPHLSCSIRSFLCSLVAPVSLQDLEAHTHTSTHGFDNNSRRTERLSRQGKQ